MSFLNSFIVSIIKLVPVLNTASKKVIEYFHCQTFFDNRKTRQIAQNIYKTECFFTKFSITKNGGSFLPRILCCPQRRQTPDPLELVHRPCPH
jgi:hypothetical protein